MKEKTLLVTGGLGYIGSHTVVELLNQNYEVFVVDDLSNSDDSVLDNIESITGKKVPFLQMDLKDETVLNDLFQQYSFSAIVHFAASKSVGESVADPIKYYHNNVLGLVNLLRQMANHNVPNIVFSSSCTVYGQPDVLPVTEETPFKKAQSPYGNTKKICEDILRDSCKTSNDLNAISLRYFNPVGAHSSGVIGEAPRGIPNNLLPYLMDVAAGERDVLSVYGDDYDTKDGTAVRDYIHVVDLAKAHVIALDRQLQEMQKTNYEFFNLGSGNGYSVLEVIKTFEKVNDIKINYQITDRRPGDVEKIYADNTLSREELGWEPELGLDKMMSSAWAYKKRLKGK